MRIGSYLKKKYKGSYTIEMSLVMPFVLGVILLVIYICIYSHDKVVMQSAMICSLSEIKNEEIANMDEKEIISKIDAICEKSLIGIWEKNISVACDEGEVNEKINAMMNSSQSLMNKLNGGGLFVCNLKRREKTINESGWVRNQ